MPPPNSDGNCRRQLAMFAAGAFSLIGVGTVIVLLMLWRDAGHGKAAERPPEAAPTPVATDRE